MVSKVVLEACREQDGCSDDSTSPSRISLKFEVSPLLYTTVNTPSTPPKIFSDSVSKTLNFQYEEDVSSRPISISDQLMPVSSLNYDDISSIDIGDDSNSIALGNYKESEQRASKVVLEMYSERDVHKFDSVNIASSPKSPLKLVVDKERVIDKDGIIFNPSSIKLDADIYTDENILKSKVNYKGNLLEFLQNKSNDDGTYTSTITLEDGFTATGQKGK